MNAQADPDVRTRQLASAEVRIGTSVIGFDHPIFAGVAAHCGLVSDTHGQVNARLNTMSDDLSVHFVTQTDALLADGLHYEERIARRGLVATRDRSTHDLFNAMIWLEHTALKRAMNARQVADIARVGPKQRTRGQCALTHFDEAGAIVWLASDELLDAWNRHDWARLFAKNRSAWGERIAVTVIGHALLDYAAIHGEMPVAKALAVMVDRSVIVSRNRAVHIASWASAERSIAHAIVTGRCLADPQELRPLPLAGIPGWSAGAEREDFYARAPCFRPLRPGRHYPAPLTFVFASDTHANAHGLAADRGHHADTSRSAVSRANAAVRGRRKSAFLR